MSLSNDVFKNMMTGLKGNVLKATTEISSSQCYAAKLYSNFGLCLLTQTSLKDDLNR